jgi:ribonuclease HI
MDNWGTSGQISGFFGPEPLVRVKAVRTLNPTTYLPEEEGEPLHSCKEILEEVFSSRPDLTDTAIPNTNLELFTDGSWSLQERGYWTRYAVTTVTQVEHSQLPDHWSAQRAELYTLTRALTLADGKRANIYTDLNYAFATLHIHGASYKERGLLTSGGKEIKNSQQVLQLLEAVWKPQAIAIIHCLAHTNRPDKISQGNRLVDRIAKEAFLSKEVQKEDATPTKVCLALPVLLD